jgi:hypothetical protein
MEMFETALMHAAAGAEETLVEQVEAIVDALIRFKRDRADITIAMARSKFGRRASSKRHFAMISFDW